jgi:DNA-binding Lrp family transcriptional regulator
VIISNPKERDAILLALSDEYSRRILFSANASAKKVEDIANETGIPVSTCYRRLKELVALGLLSAERIVITDDGKKSVIFQSSVESASIVISSGEIFLDIKHTPPELNSEWETPVIDKLNKLLNHSLELLGADMGNIQLADGEGRMKIVTQRGFKQPFLDFFNVVNPCTRSACGAAESSKKRVIVKDVTKSPIFRSTRALPVLLEADVRAVQSTPLIARSGDLIGVISTHYPDPHIPNESDLQQFDLLVREMMDCLPKIPTTQGK